jgi:hypothetical protein
MTPGGAKNFHAIYLLKATHGTQNTPPAAIAQALHQDWWRFHGQSSEILCDGPRI